MDKIIQSLHNDAPLHCHKTIDYSQDEHADQVDDAVYCAGALGYMVKAKDINLPIRLGIMFDLFRPDELQDLDDLIDPKEE